MAIDFIALSAAKKYTEESILGGGAIVGKNVIISNIEPINGGNRITFLYTLDNGIEKTSTLDVMNGEKGNNGLDGVSIEKIELTSNSELKTILTDGSYFITEPLPSLKGENGVDGITPHIGNNGNWYIGDKDTGISASGESTSTGISGYQYVKLNVFNGDIVDIKPDKFKNVDDYTNIPIIIQAYKFIPDKDNVSRIVKTFNNTKSSNFIYNDDNVSFDDGMHIKSDLTFEVLLDTVSSTYISEEINLGDMIMLVSVG